MKNKKIIFLFLTIFTLGALIFCNFSMAAEVTASFETDANTRITTVKIKSNKKMNKVKFYKKTDNGKYILFYISNPESESLECNLKSTFFSEEKETELKIVVIDDEGTSVIDKKVDKLPQMPTMNPEETAKPTTSEIVIPTKPTPTTHASEAPAASPSGSTSPSGGANPSGTANPSGSGTKITGIKLNKNSVTLKVGGKDKLTYTVTPEGAHERLIWRTDAAEICKIEADGTITGVKEGKAQISIRTESGVTDICAVTVTKDTSASPKASNTDSAAAGSVEELRNRLVETAKKEVGTKNGQKYLDYFNTTQAPGGWCSEFASWCAHQCGYVEKGIIPKKDGCGEFSSWFKKKGRFKERSYIPKPGDICFMGGNNVTHTCIVVGVDEEKGKFYTVDGGSSVNKYTRTLKSSDIYGFGVPDYESIAN